MFIIYKDHKKEPILQPTCHKSPTLHLLFCHPLYFEKRQ